MHGTENVLLGGLAHGVLLVIRKNDHVLSPVSEMLNQVSSHVANIIDAPPQLTTLAEVIDANQQAFPTPSAVGVAVCIALRSSLAEVLGLGWGRWRASTVAISGRCKKGNVRTCDPTSKTERKGLRQGRITHEVGYVGSLAARERNIVVGELLVAGGGVSAQTRHLAKVRKPSLCNSPGNIAAAEEAADSRTQAGTDSYCSLAEEDCTQSVSINFDTAAALWALDQVEGWPYA